MAAAPSAAPDPTTTSAADGRAAELRALLETQRAAFARGAPDYARRMESLLTLRDAVRARKDELVRAVSADFGGRAAEETLLLELFPLFDEIRHARRHLKRWMRRRRVGSSWFLLPSRAYVMAQPLGVVGVMAAWNYQLFLSLSPLVDVLAAGNHAIVKPSEVTPRTAQVIAELLDRAFPREYVAAVTGGPDVAATFAALPFDHLVFTGSTRVGRQVMRAAAEHLTPVTLELGGKSPAIVHPAYPLALAAERIVGGKLANAGQTCVAPDYVLVPRGREAEFEARVREAAAARYPRLVANPDYTRIVTRAHWERLAAAVAEARAGGARVVEVNPAGETFSAEEKVFPPTLVFGAPEGAALMREEIFGPVLPVVPYDTLDGAIDYVNARPRPLALYYFDDDRARVDRVLERTVAGGVTVNDCVYHLAQHELPFGGVGPSGMGHYHGEAGFRQFSKEKGVMVQSRFGGGKMLQPPYTAKTRALIERVVRMVSR